MSLTLILLLVAAIAGLVAYFAIRAAIGKAGQIAILQGELDHAQKQLENAKEIYTRALEARRQLEQDLALLRAGTPTDKLAASVDILQDVSGNTARKPAPGLADLTAAARAKP